ncbi:hypothetical protein T190115A13A_10018 [Tenacibaculum sp. 190524A02b]|uniref:Uncharacterized protein n=1 Tax=Tenacibaculum vairaonense TaxID=3137860 RepID=A0ABM9PJN9_9FLAO
MWWLKFYEKKFKKSVVNSKKSYIFASAINKQGRVAQLVQSTWFTPKGSGVRIPSRPQP